MSAALRRDMLRGELLRFADLDAASAMRAYMKHRFEFFGVKAPQRRACQRAWAR